MEFQGFPKIPRLSRDCVITEKLDGTNAQVYIAELCANGHVIDQSRIICCSGKMTVSMSIGSRNRWLSKEQDNYRFYSWCQQHREELLELGPGRHFGEWWGGGIQRGYGLKGDDKRFSLFHAGDIAKLPACVSVVPILYHGPFDTLVIQDQVDRLRAFGSTAVPGYMNPEGIVIYHVASGHLYKKTLLNDEKPKGVTDAKEA